VVVDTYARVMVGGNENDSKDAGQVVAHCGAIQKVTGAMVVLVHHSGKEPAAGRAARRRCARRPTWSWR
jgi:RecA-family ATPase